MLLPILRLFKKDTVKEEKLVFYIFSKEEVFFNLILISFSKKALLLW
jgi:hypothetical protein